MLSAASKSQAEAATEGRGLATAPRGRGSGSMERALGNALRDLSGKYQSQIEELKKWKGLATGAQQLGAPGGVSMQSAVAGGAGGEQERVGAALEHAREDIQAHVSREQALGDALRHLSASYQAAASEARMWRAKAEARMAADGQQQSQQQGAAGADGNMSKKSVEDTGTASRAPPRRAHGASADDLEQLYKKLAGAAWAQPGPEATYAVRKMSTEDAGASPQRSVSAGKVDVEQLYKQAMADQAATAEQFDALKRSASEWVTGKLREWGGRLNQTVSSMASNLGITRWEDAAAYLTSALQNGTGTHWGAAAANAASGGVARPGSGVAEEPAMEPTHLGDRIAALTVEGRRLKDEKEAADVGLRVQAKALQEWQGRAEALSRDKLLMAKEAADEMAHLQDSLAGQAASDARAMRDQIAALAAGGQRLKAERDAAAAKLRGQAKELQEWRARAEKVRYEQQRGAEKATGAWLQAQGKMAAGSKVVEQMRGEIAALSAAGQRLKAEGGAAAAEVQRLRAHIGAAAAEVQRLKRERDAAAAEVQSAAAQRRNAEGGAAAAEVQRLRAERGAAAAEVQRLNRERNAAAAEVHRLKEEGGAAAAKLQSGMQAWKARAELLQQRMAEGSRGGWPQPLSAKDGAAPALEADMQALGDEVKHLRAWKDTATKLQALLEQRGALLAQQNEESAGELERERRTVEEMASEKKQLRDSLTALLVERQRWAGGKDAHAAEGAGSGGEDAHVAELHHWKAIAEHLRQEGRQLDAERKAEQRKAQEAAAAWSHAQVLLEERIAQHEALQANWVQARRAMQDRAEKLAAAATAAGAAKEAGGAPMSKDTFTRACIECAHPQN